MLGGKYIFVFDLVILAQTLPATLVLFFFSPEAATRE